jgi:hypothetical protein
MVTKMSDWFLEWHIDECSNLSSQLTNNFLSKIITGDETSCFQYDPESKQQSLQWKQPTSL